MTVIFVVLGIAQAALWAGMAVTALSVMWRLERQRPRRRANPAVWAGLLVAASAGVGTSLLVVRQVLLRVLEESWYWLLLQRQPDLLGEIGNGLCSILAAGGALLLARGLAGVLILEASGRLPRALAPPPGLDDTHHGRTP